MRRVVLDTDILSEIIKLNDPRVAARATEYAREHGRFTLTAVTAHEIVFGLASKQATQKIAAVQTLFAENEVVIPILEDYVLAGQVRGAARRLGKQIALDDCLIGAIAYRLGIPVSTGNTSHFEDMRQAGLAVELENWRRV